MPLFHGPDTGIPALRRHNRTEDRHEGRQTPDACANVLILRGLLRTYVRLAKLVPKLLPDYASNNATEPFS